MAATCSTSRCAATASSSSGFSIIGSKPARVAGAAAVTPSWQSSPALVRFARPSRSPQLEWCRRAPGNTANARSNVSGLRLGVGALSAVADDFLGQQQQQPQALRYGGEGTEPQTAADTVGVLLLNLGGPETLDDVQPFLYNLFADPDIIRLPPAISFLQAPLAWFISNARASKSKEGYETIGGGSPLRRITEEQADALTEALHSKGVNGKVYVAMRYWNPYTEEAVEQIKADGVTRLVVLPLYPQFSISTSGSSLRLLEQLFKTDPVLRKLKHTVIPSWYSRPGFVSAQVDLIEAELRKFAVPENVEIFFSAHGVPKSYVEEAGDPYKEEMEACVSLIMNEAVRRGIANHHTLAYQSRVGPVEWLKPYTDDTIRDLGARGCKSLLAVPISFVSEHIETLEEIDCEYRELAEESGIKNWGRVPALDTNPVFINDLAQAVVDALPYVGSIAISEQSLVPMGDIESLMETYDRDRLALPAPYNDGWRWGWTKSAELWNGRIAMIAIIVIFALEFTTGEGVLSQVLL
eukprot:CAMPEP_0177767952 /NCGR_PEP_ID=MMETSP0491_2-20121128/9438_1 /TAXON_ID=63592 /ORGANISM="Tetraselmis chuii, Strain PLY429" /LENGTH=523 /DNA_ID=CAMNT_0019284679 /DNA_START=281 /DNA_END=1852 /DNA_ORIENTATION=+